MVASAFEGSRAAVGWELIKRELSHEITGEDMVGDCLAAVRNGFTGLIRGASQIVPSVLNAGSSQRFQLIERQGPFTGTANAVGNVYRTAKEGNLLGAASAIVFEGTDGVVDDAFGLVGGAPYHVRAVSGSSRYDMARAMETGYALAA